MSQKAPAPKELRRLARLRLLGILDTPPEPAFDSIVRLAARICGVEISLVSLVDESRQWFKANFGLTQVQQTGRDVAFCDHAIRGTQIFEVQDARLDARFQGNPLVTGEPGIRFYAGAPIVMPDGECVGTLCVVDRQPRSLAPSQHESLGDLAVVVRDLLLQREKSNSAATGSGPAYDAALVELMPAGLLQADGSGQLVHVNPAWKSLFGVGEEEALGGGWLAKVHPEDREGVVAAWSHAVSERVACEREFRILDGGMEKWVRCALRPITGPQGECRGFVGVTSDVTVLVAAERALADSNRFLERAESIAGMGSWSLDVATGELAWTAQVRRILQLPAHHRPSLDDHFRYLEPADRAKLQEAHKAAIEKGTGWDMTLRLTTAAGQSIGVRSVGVPERLRDGCVRLLGTIQDITVPLEREQALRRANAVLQTVIDNLPCGLSVFDGDHRLLTSNAKFRELLNLPQSLFHSQTTFGQLARFRADRGDYGPGDPAELVRRAEASARNSLPHAFQRENPDGTVLDILGASLPGGGVVTTYVDVTSAKAAERALRISEDRQKRALEASGLVLWDIDLRSGRLFLSDNWSVIVGEEAAAGEPRLERLFELVPEHQRAPVRKAFVAAIKGEAAFYDVEHQVRVGEKHWVWIHSRGQVTEREASGRAVRISGTHADISGRRAVEQALLEAKELAESANLAKTRFITTISHEIRTPLNGVIGLTRLLLGQDIEARHRRLVELLDASGQALMALVDDVLDMGKIEAGQLTLDAFDFDLHAMLNDLADLYTLRCDAKGLTFRLRVDPDIPEQVRGDGHRLRQILNNLLSNALKFTERGSIALTVAAHEDKASSRWLVFRVVDSGVGIPHAARTQLFQRFVQVDGSTTRRHGGSGLGLAIVKELCERMGGSVAVQSEMGKGSCFEVALPFEAALFDERVAESAFHALAALEPGTSGILVVEDNPTNQVVVMGLLEQAGWDDVVLARDGMEALEAVSRHSFSAVLMDCHMPNLDGFEAARRMRALGKAMPIIALTAGVTDAERRKCLEHGMNDVVTKPISPAKLYRSLRQWTGWAPRAAASTPRRLGSGAKAAIFDAEGALDRLGGDEGLLRAAIEAFLDEWPVLARRLRAASGDDDLRSARRELHSIAGSASAVGATQVIEVSQDLHQMCARGEPMPEAGLARLEAAVDAFARAAGDRHSSL